MRDKNTFFDTYNKINQEGVGYYILSYTDGEELPDKKSKKLFDKANKALKKFLGYIEKQKDIEILKGNK